MKFILTVNNMYVKSVSIDSYDGTASCTFTSNLNDAKEFFSNETVIIKSLVEDLLGITLVALNKTEGGDINVD